MFYNQPDNIIIDFEKSKKNEFCEYIPNINIHGCFFHFSQDHFSQNLKLQDRYRNDVNYINILKKFL